MVFAGYAWSYWNPLVKNALDLFYFNIHAILLLGGYQGSAGQKGERVIE
jgi:hypothetical protein